MWECEGGEKEEKKKVSEGGFFWGLVGFPPPPRLVRVSSWRITVRGELRE